MSGDAYCLDTVHVGQSGDPSLLLTQSARLFLFPTPLGLAVRANAFD
jgi:hypothetical protein